MNMKKKKNKNKVIIRNEQKKNAKINKLKSKFQVSTFAQNLLAKMKRNEEKNDLNPSSRHIHCVA